MTVQILRFGDIFTPPHLFSTTVPFSIITLMTKAAIGLRGQRDDGAAPHSQEAEEPPREMVAGGRGIDQSECLGRAGRSGESGAVNGLQLRPGTGVRARYRLRTAAGRVLSASDEGTNEYWTSEDVLCRPAAVSCQLT